MSVQENILVEVHGSSSRLGRSRTVSLQSTASSVGSCRGDGSSKRSPRSEDDSRLQVRNRSSESVCTSIMGNPVSDWENSYVSHRQDVVAQDGFFVTPLHLIKQLAYHVKEEMTIEHYALQNTNNPKEAIYRVDIMLGGIRGVGQCTRQQLARQLAAIDLYEKMQLAEKEPELRSLLTSRAGILPGWRVDQNVFKAVNNAIETSEEPGAKLKFQVKLPADGKLGQFTAICRVGSLETKGRNDIPSLAKKLAAKEMYENLTGEEYSVQSTQLGSEVIAFPQMRLLGFKPQITSAKRKWLMDHRITDTQMVTQSSEPDDGNDERVENEAQRVQWKRFKHAELKQPTLKITVKNELSKQVSLSGQSTLKQELTSEELEAENSRIVRQLNLLTFDSDFDSDTPDVPLDTDDEF